MRSGGGFPAVGTVKVWRCDGGKVWSWGRGGCEGVGAVRRIFVR